MFSAEITIILMLITLLSVLMTGFPVAFTLSGVALIFGLGGTLFGIFDLNSNKINLLFNYRDLYLD